MNAVTPAVTPLPSPTGKPRIVIAAIRSLLIALLLVLAALPAVARDRMGSLQEAIEAVQRETGGRVLSADVVRAGPRELYRIKVLTPDGRVRVITRSSRGGARR